MSTHCPGCCANVLGANDAPPPSVAPNPDCGGCGHEEEIARLTKELKIATLKAAQLHIFCGDHYDKQRSKPCLACEVERLTVERNALRAMLCAVARYPLRHQQDCASLDLAHAMEHDIVAACDCGRDAVVARVQAVWEGE